MLALSKGRSGRRWGAYAVLFFTQFGEDSHCWVWRFTDRQVALRSNWTWVIFTGHRADIQVFARIVFSISQICWVESDIWPSGLRFYFSRKLAAICSGPAVPTNTVDNPVDCVQCIDCQCNGQNECDVTHWKWLASESTKWSLFSRHFSQYRRRYIGARNCQLAVISLSWSESMFLCQPFTPIRSELIGSSNPYHLKGGYRKSNNRIIDSARSTPHPLASADAVM